jgi:hypothetical protein
VTPITVAKQTGRPKADDLADALHDGQWRIAHGLNTVIDPSAQRFDP